MGVHTVKIESEALEEQKDTKDLLSDIGFQKARYDLPHKTTMIVDLSPPKEELLARMKGKTRYNVRLAAMKGVGVEEIGFEQVWDTFYGLLEGAAKRNGFAIRRSREYLHDSMRAIYDAGQGHFFFATHRREPLAAIIVFNFGEKCWYIHGTSSNQRRILIPNYLLQWEVMRWARERGIRYYYMVVVPRPENLDEKDPLWGVCRFKAGFGGEIADFLGCLDLPIKPVRAAAWYRYEPVYYRLYQKLKQSVFY